MKAYVLLRALTLRGLLCFAVLGLLTISTSAATTTLIASNSSWRYLADGTDPGTAWRHGGFDDSGWSNGVAKLGFGGDGEVTSIGDATNGFTTFYFRRSFIDSGATVFNQMQVRLLRDDGAVVYLNGVELFRQNMPTGAVDYLTLAATTVSGATENTYFVTSVPAAIALLQPGVNTLAVEVHQVATNSSDVGFDLELAGIADTTPPSVTLTNPPSNVSIIAGDNLPLGATAADDSGVAQVEFYANGILLGIDATEPYVSAMGNARFGTYELTAVAQDIAGLRATSAPVSLTVTLDPSRVTLVQNGACWRFWDRGLAPGDDWRQPEYDDNAWPVGFAELGYGDGDETTIVSFGPDPDDKFITTYFRHRFNLLKPEDYTNLVLRVKRDDGVVVYLNGIEVFRDNLPAGPVVDATTATNAVDDGATYLTASVAPAFLRKEDNVIAVEVHQTSTNSSDISFDLQLLGETGWNPPSLSIETNDSNAVIVSWPASTATNLILQSRAELEDSIPWVEATITPELMGDRYFATVPIAGLSRFLRLCASGPGPEPCQSPLVVTQSHSMVAAVGTTVALSVQAVGAPALSYQWRRNEVFLTGETSSTLVKTNIQIADGGAYDVIVGNECGCTLSCPILLAVGAVPVTLADNFADRLQTNGLSGSVVGSNALASRELSEPVNPSRLFGRSVWLEWTAPVSGIAVVSTEGSGQETALAIYRGSQLTTLELEASTGPDGRPRTSQVQFNAVGGVAYQVQVDGNGFTPMLMVNWNLTPTTACAPQIIVQPQEQVVPVGGDGTLTVVATNCPADPIAYQWFGDGIPLAGATNATLTVSNMQLADAAVFSALLTNSAGSARSLPVPIIMANAGSISVPRDIFFAGMICDGKKFNSRLTLCYKATLTTLTGCSLGNVNTMFPTANQNQPNGALALTISTVDPANKSLDTALKLASHGEAGYCSMTCSNASAPTACFKLSSQSIPFGQCTNAASCVLVTVYFNTTTAYGNCSTAPVGPVVVNHSYP